MNDDTNLNKARDFLALRAEKRAERIDQIEEREDEA